MNHSCLSTPVLPRWMTAARATRESPPLETKNRFANSPQWDF